MLLLAVALLVRAVVPQGFMLDRAADGVTIAMCNSNMTMTIPFKDGPKKDGQGPTKADQSGDPCAFAGHQSAATPPEGLAPLPLPLLAPAPYNAVRERALSPASPHHLPPATGPPILV
jgi:hypothetical protein